MLYQNLIEQYQKLSVEEQNALLIYKTRLGRAINDLTNDAEVTQIYQEYYQKLSNPKNYFIKNTIFSNFSFANLAIFKEQLLKITELLLEACNKIVVPEKTKVYRAFSVKKDELGTSIAKNDLISTSLNIDVCEDFLIFDSSSSYKHYLYEIVLEPNSLVGICPYAILDNKLEDQLILTQRTDQQELILNKNNYDFEIKTSKKVLLENNEELYILQVLAHLKELNQNNIQKK